MEETTTDSLNYLAMEDNDGLGIRLPKMMKQKIVDETKRQGIKSVSVYVKLAVADKLEKDLNK